MRNVKYTGRVNARPLSNETCTHHQHPPPSRYSAALASIYHKFNTCPRIMTQFCRPSRAVVYYGDAIFELDRNRALRTKQYIFIQVFPTCTATFLFLVSAEAESSRSDHRRIRIAVALTRFNRALSLPPSRFTYYRKIIAKSSLSPSKRK